MESRHQSRFVEFSKIHQEAVREATKSSEVRSQHLLAPTTPGLMETYLDEYKSATKYSHTDPRQKRINENLAILIGTSSLPIRLVSYPSFKKFVNDLNPHARVPEQSKVKRELDNLWDTVKISIGKALNFSRESSVTADIWTSKNLKYSYLGLTVHFFDPESKKKCSRKIACREIASPHTGVRIADMIADILDEYKIFNKVNFIVTDNGSNMIKSIRVLGDDLSENSEDDDDENVDALIVDVAGDPGGLDVPDEVVSEDDAEYTQRDEEVTRTLKSKQKKRGRCFSHTLQLGLNSIFKRKGSLFNQTLVKSRTFTSKYRKSAAAKYALRNTSFKKSLLGHCPSRWFSDIPMAKSLVEAGECEDHPLLALSDTMKWDIEITPAEIKNLKMYLEIMSPLAKQTDILGGEKYSTIHLVSLCG